MVGSPLSSHPTGKKTSLPRIRQKRAIESNWTYPKTVPRWSEPLTVGGGVSIA